MNLRKLISALTVVILVGCETSEITMDKMYLKEITIPTCSTDQFEYEGGRLISYKRLFGERVATSTKFIHQSNLLKTIEIEDDNGQIIIELIYGTNGLRERETRTRTLKQDNEVKTSTTTYFFYDENKNLRLKHISYTDPNFLSSETEFEWANGNIVKKNYFYFDSEGSRHYTSSDKLLFDNKKNYTNQDLAFIYTGLYDEAVLSQNNVISKPNKYEYNNGGYPIKYKYSIGDKDYPVLMSYE